MKVRTMIVKNTCAAVFILIGLITVIIMYSIYTEIKYSENISATARNMIYLSEALDRLPADKYPENIQELLQYDEVSQRHLVDAIEGKDIIYAVEQINGEKEWRLISPGPDQVLEYSGSQSSFTQYDSLHDESGDFVFSPTINPNFVRIQPSYGKRKGKWKKIDRGWKKEAQQQEP